MDEDTKKLQEIRDTVLNELSPLLLNSDISPEEKFSMQLSAAQMSGKVERFQEALDTARKFTEETSKANAYMDLIDTIDGHLIEDKTEPQVEEEAKNTEEAQQD